MKRTSGIMLGIAIAGLGAGAGSAPAQPVRVVRRRRRRPRRPTARPWSPRCGGCSTENYVLPEVRPKLDAALAKGLAEGRYDVADPAVLVERINADLAAVAHDKHLGLQYDPRQAAELAAAPQGQRDDGPPTRRARSARRSSATTASSR